MTSRFRSRIALILLLLAAGGVQAQANAAPDPMREELRRVLLHLIEAGEFGSTPPQDIAFVLDAPAQRTGNLGVVVDSANSSRATDGLRVIAVNPGSTAQRLGLRAGDVITTINGESLAGLGADRAGHALAAQRLRDRVDALDDGGRLAFTVQRDGRGLELAGSASSVTLPPIHLVVGRDELLVARNVEDAGRARRDAPAPSATGCGYVNTFDVAPRGENIHAIKLLSIDGNLAGPEGRTNFRLSAGHHELQIAENIERPYLSIGPRQRAAGRSVKPLSIDVAPNTTYYLGAQLQTEKRLEWKDGGYWEPVVWKQAEADCR